MFFVTLLLNEVIGWMRAQEGTGSLRAILYMDEIFGFFPPVKAPPSKAPMLTLLKQARAFGLGVVLATQNPVDLDYKGLANIGTWFLGRLQPERDRERLMEGLASASGGFDRKKTEEILSSLGQRVFLMQNVHEDRPVVFQTRWALSYLRGPLDPRAAEEARPGPRPKRRPPPCGESKKSPSRDRRREAERASSVAECFLGSEGAVYRPAFSRRLRSTTSPRRRRSTIGTEPARASRGSTASRIGERDRRRVRPSRTSPTPALDCRAPRCRAAEELCRLGEISEGASLPGTALVLFDCRPLRMTSRPDESEADFRARLSHRLREKRDEERRRSAAVRAGATPVEEAIRRGGPSRARVHPFQGRTLDTAVDFGLTLRRPFGRKLGSVTNVKRATQTARSASRASRERGDVARAEADLAAQKEKLARLEAEFVEKTAALAVAPEVELQTLSLPPRKSDIRIERLALAWHR
jgi:hypothetical protein